MVLTAEILIVGTEILEGKTCDRNSKFLRSQLKNLGISVKRITVLRDDLEEVKEALQRAKGRSQLVFVTGGLGVTPDDVTREAISKAFGIRLVKNEALLQKIKEKFKEYHLPWEEADERFALLPEGAEVLPNPLGLCGFKLSVDDTEFFFLPGVPEEVEAVFKEGVFPYLKGKGRGFVAKKTLKCFGLTEGRILELISDIKGPFEVSYLPVFPEVHLELTVKAGSQREAEEILKHYQSIFAERLGLFLFGTDLETMESVVGKLLKARGLTLSTAESCTGGLIAHRLTEVPGSSEYFLGGIVSYSNQSKMRDLFVSQRTLEEQGPVSRECALEMAQGVRKRFMSSLGLATTGIAGPTGGTEETPVGTVFIAWSAEGEEEVKRYRFFGNRSQIKLMASEVALDRIRRFLLRNSSGYKEAP